ncbi:arf1-directed GTPase-activating related protein [Cyclospora cayetanensis]|uniref:Arf1-directed GTPase-activating related protein n=1 Tax=Cyclospora cayetanensis TaxID=88456 RepID=A0A1D3D699_9EIME|nr:arf1-directed GTPase-activating related protein [Cyclospora cayetanensis]
MPPKERYATKAAAYYRALLRSAAEPSITAPPLPLKHSALQSVTSFVSGAREYTAKTFEAAGESNFVEKAKGGLQSGSEWIAQQGKRISSTFTLAALASSLPIDCSIDEHCDAAGSDASADGGCTSSSPRLSEEQPQEGEEGLQSQQRSGSGVLDSMRDFTRRSLSNVSQVVRSSNSGVGEGGGVLEKAREGLSSLTAVATGWLQPAETPSPESSPPKGLNGGPDIPEKPCEFAYAVTLASQTDAMGGKERDRIVLPPVSSTAVGEESDTPILIAEAQWSRWLAGRRGCREAAESEAVLSAMR